MVESDSSVDLVPEVFTPDGIPAFSGSRRVAALHHGVWDDAMEDDIVVVSAPPVAHAPAHGIVGSDAFVARRTHAHAHVAAERCLAI